MALHRAGKPPQNAFVESFDARFRDGRLNETLFSTLTEARNAIRSWKEDHIPNRCNSAFGNATAAGFALKPKLEKQAAQGQRLSSGLSLGQRKKKVSV